MKIQKILLCLLASVAFSSCQLATFNARPGVIVSEFPKEVQGTYITVEKIDGLKDTHTLIINDKGAKVEGDPLVSKIVNLKDTNNSLSHLGNFYYLNVRETDSLGRYFWYIYPFEYDKNNLFVYKINLGKKNLKRLGKRLKANELRKGEFIMDNEAFKKYCQKYLKKKNAIKFNRIK